jgi:uncharacterized protein (TIGR02118 family)
MIKLMIMVRRNPALNPSQFRDHLSQVHSRLVRDCPASRELVRKYVQSYAVQGLNDETAFDGAAELWFDNASDMDRFFSDPAYLATVRPDEPRFADLENCIFLVTEEAQII